MINQTFTVATGTLRAALTTAKAFASAEPDEYRIHAVALRPTEQGIEVTATDRYTMSWETISVLNGTPFPMLIPLKVVRRVLDLLPRTFTTTGVVTFTLLEGNRVKVAPSHDTLDLTFAPIEDPDLFPDRVKLLAKYADRDAIETTSDVRINPAFLARVTKALSGRGRDPLAVEFTTDSGPVMLRTETANALIMPVRKPEAETR